MSSANQHAAVLLRSSIIAVAIAASGCSARGGQNATPRIAQVRGAIERVGPAEFVVRTKAGYRIPVSLDSETRYAAQKATGQETCLAPGRRVGVKALLEGGRWIAREVSFAGRACLPPTSR